jgi:hypothetical protein
MKQLISMILSFLQRVLAVALVGSAVCLIAAEVRLAALKKASLGSTKLSKFTERMTGVKLDL